MFEVDRFAVAQSEVVLQRSSLRAQCGRSPAGRRGAVLTVLEEAVVKVLPLWPEAYAAVMEYARLEAGVRGEPDERP